MNTSDGNLNSETSNNNITEANILVVSDTIMETENISSDEPTTSTSKHKVDDKPIINNYFDGNNDSKDSPDTSLKVTNDFLDIILFSNCLWQVHLECMKSNR